MRTHLMKTIYAPPAAEVDTGHAANEPRYVTLRTIVAASPAPCACTEHRGTPPSNENDDYCLGGYAGI
jgi:hypothetical protein